MRGGSTMTGLLAVVLLSLVSSLEQVMPQITDCDSTFSSDGRHRNGTFSTLDYPRPYKQNMQCQFIFKAAANERVRIDFIDFDLRGPTSECEGDYVDVYSELTLPEVHLEWGNVTVSRRYCGTVLPQPQVSLYNYLMLGFYSDGAKEASGFQARYTFIDSDIYVTGVQSQGSTCDYTIYSNHVSRGQFMSPTYPGSYPINLNCTFRFMGQPGERVKIHFRDFDVYSGGSHCPYDWMKVYDGAAPRLVDGHVVNLIGGAPICGEKHQVELFSSRESLVAVFETSWSPRHENRGFDGQFQFSRNFVKLDHLLSDDLGGQFIAGTECDQLIRSTGESSGLIRSPRYDGPTRNLTCRYFIEGLKNSWNLEKAHVIFLTFDLPTTSRQPQQCGRREGFIALYLHEDVDPDTIDVETGMDADRKWCGNQLPANTTSQGHRTLIVFHSGDRHLTNSFTAQYRFETDYGIQGTAAPDGSCHFTYEASSQLTGRFNSPRNPANYPPATDCTYVFHSRPDLRLRMQFARLGVDTTPLDDPDEFYYGMKACQDDWVEIYNIYQNDGKETDVLLGRYCNAQVPGPVIADVGVQKMKVLFHSDSGGQTVAQGFAAVYKFVTPKYDSKVVCQSIGAGLQGGLIRSPGFKHIKYQLKTACDWRLQVRAGQRIMLHFTQWLGVEGNMAGLGCGNAVLRVYTNTSGTPAGEFCHGSPDSLPARLHMWTSDGPYLRLTFSTGEQIAGGLGFMATWVAFTDDDECKTGIKCQTNGFCISKDVCSAALDGVSYCGRDDSSDRKHCDASAVYANVLLALVATAVAMATVS